jgi:hypothetical protein
VPIVLARAQAKQNDWNGADRTLTPLYASGDAPADVAIFLATVRLKRTSMVTTRKSGRNSLTS